MSHVEPKYDVQNHIRHDYYRIKVEVIRKLLLLKSKWNSAAEVELHLVFGTGRFFHVEEITSNLILAAGDTEAGSEIFLTVLDDKEWGWLYGYGYTTGTL